MPSVDVIVTATFGTCELYFYHAHCPCRTSSCTVSLSFSLSAT